MEANWTVDQLHRMFANPVYAGIGEYPAIVGDEPWLAVNARSVQEDGAQAAIGNILARFAEEFPAVELPEDETYVREAEHDPRSALRRLLADLRDVVQVRET